MKCSLGLHLLIVTILSTLQVSHSQHLIHQPHMPYQLKFTSVNITPFDASCTDDNVTLPAYLNGRFSPGAVVRCSGQTSCITSSSAKKITAKKIFNSDGTLQIGQDGCLIPTANHSVGKFPSVKAISEFNERQVRISDKFCFTDLHIMNPSDSKETLFLSFKLDTTSTNGTLLDYRNFSVDVEEMKLIFSHDNNIVGQMKKEVSLKNGWNQIAIQIDYTANKSEHRIFQEGETSNSFSADSLPLTSADSNTVKLTLGSYRNYGGHHLKAVVRNIEVYEGLLVHEEIYKKHKGYSLDVPRPECICPQNAPYFDYAKNKYALKCKDTSGNYYNRIPIEYGTGNNQLMKVDFLPEYMTDGDTDIQSNNLNFWVSATESERFSIDVTFGNQQVLYSVDIHLLKPMPSKSLSIELRQKNEWKVIHRFANNCEDLGLPSFVTAERPDIVGCTPYEMAGVQGAGLNGDYQLSWKLSQRSSFYYYYYYGDRRVFEVFRGEALRLVFDGLPGGNLLDKTEMYHAVSEIKASAILIDRPLNCGCYEDGTFEGLPCNSDKQCKCKLEVDEKLAGKQCLPYIEVLNPKYGPKLGGTLIVIKGGGFGRAARNVTIGNMKCPVNDILSNSTLTICQTSPLSDDDLLGKPLQVRLHLTAHFNARNYPSSVPFQPTRPFVINYRYPFVYKADPGIFLRKSIIKRSIQQAIRTQDFDTSTDSGFPTALARKALVFPNLTGQTYSARTNPTLAVTMKTKSGATTLSPQPHIDVLYPTFGPKTGGTVIVIRGGAFGKGARNVTIGNMECPVNKTLSNSTLTICRTRPLINDHLLDQPLEILLHFTSHFKAINYSFPFVYKPDPSVTDIFPRKSITKGGILQTVIGLNLDSVAFPKLVVYMTSKSGVQMLGPEKCYVRNFTLMECLTPVIPMPKLHSHLNKRSVANSNNDIIPRRFLSVKHKRSTQQNWINDQELDWHMGLIFDGLPTYLNLSESLPEKSQLIVYTFPVIYTFNPEVQTFKVHKGQTTIDIKGEKLQYGVQEDDYHISVGHGVCEIIQLLNNLIVCSPHSNGTSDEIPLGHDIHESGALRVKVRIGEWYTVHVGFLDYEMTLWDNLSVRVGVITCILLLLVIPPLACHIYVLLKDKKRKKRNKKLNEPGHIVSYHRQDNLCGEQRNLLDRIEPGLMQVLKPCLFDAEKLSLQQEIGKGNFGVVYAGELKEGTPHKVAVKTIKGQQATLTEISEFLDEAVIMTEFDHKNVLPLLGVVIQTSDVYVVLPFMEKGSLKDYVGNNKNAFSVVDLVNMSSQACEGMAYLESKRFVHRDLAARNCMVNEQNVVKIADFGLARDIYETDYYRPEDKHRPLPYKWMAIECVVLDSRKFTTKSDVWSFGVLFWEVITRGRMPYSEIPPSQFGRYLRSNGRLEKPAHCPDDLYDIMMSCWQANPNDRPNFSDLVKTFSGLLAPFAAEKTQGLEHLEHTVSVEQDTKSSMEHSTAHNPDYLELINTPTIEDLVLFETPKLEQNILPPEYLALY